MKHLLKKMIIFNLLLTYFVVLVPTVVHAVDNNEDVIQTSEGLQDEQSTLTSTEETIGIRDTEILPTADTMSSVENSSSPEEQVEEEIIEEEPIHDFDYPKNRSEITPKRQAHAFSRAAVRNLSITDKNLPNSHFIDVSGHNGEITVDEYKIIKSYGVTGVVVKLTEATSFQNVLAGKQIRNAQAAGLVVAVYHYSWFSTTADAVREANYFHNYAQALGLPKSTLMVNDLEEPVIKNSKGHTENAIAFENQLHQLGYSNVNHYLGLHWINEKKIDPNVLGNKKVWVAAYPYQPTSIQQHTQFGAWQWSSKMTFPGVRGVFDISSDYEGAFSTPSQGNYISDGRYVTINKKGYNRWSNFNWSKKGTSNDVYGKTFLARGRYDHRNGASYFSLFDKNGTWYGYLDANATNIATGQEGTYQTDKRYVSISKQNYSMWSNFNWKWRNDTKNTYQKTYFSRGKYQHFNGSTYLSLYDESGKWHGYLNANATKQVNGPQGNYISDGRYVTIKSKNYSTWSNFNWKRRNKTENMFQQTYQAKGRYEHVNGDTYFSLYDNKGKWHGYLNTRATAIGGGAQGAYITDGQRVNITKKGYNTWSSFRWIKMNATDDIYEQTFTARGRYHHINGATYYSLYDDKGIWHGYVNANATN